MILRKKTIEKKDLREKEDQLIVDLVLSVRETIDAGPCPDPNDFAAFIDGTIEPEKRKELVAHLNACQECYNDWLAVSSVVAEPKIRNVFNEFKLTLTDFMNRFSIPKPALNYGIATAAAVCLVLFFWASRSPDLSDLMTKAYTPNVFAGISVSDLQSNNMHILPWERSEITFGFAPLHQYDLDAALAFGAGLWSARHDLAGASKTPPPDFVAKAWQDTQWAVDYWLGRWSYLLHAVALSDEALAHAFWQQQIAILNQVQEKYTVAHKKDEEAIRVVNVRLNRIKSILNKSTEGALSQENRGNISAELDLLIEFLSPGDEAVHP